MECIQHHILHLIYKCCKDTENHELNVMILCFSMDMPGQIVETQIRLLLEEQSDQVLHFLQDAYNVLKYHSMVKRLVFFLCCNYFQNTKNGFLRLFPTALNL